MPDNGRPATLPVLSGLRVLVIENNEDNLDLFALFLRQCGARVATARTATDARGYLSGQRISAIITDVSVLNGSGPDFVRQIREQPEYTDTPVIAVTGWSNKDTVHIGETPFTAFIQKPVDLDELAATIVRLVSPNGDGTHPSRTIEPAAHRSN